MTTWNTDSLEKLTSKIGSGATPRGGKESYKDKGISLVRSQNVYDFEFEESGLAFIDDEQAANLSNVKVEANDVLLNITGHSVGRCCMVPDRVLPARVNQHVMILRADTRKLDPRYLLYYVNSPQIKHQLLQQTHGATRKALTKGQMQNFEVQYPPLPTQRRNADILGALDEKIALNRQMNETLEAMAQALYRHWFVDFGPFQDQPFVDSELGPIPEGWETQEVKQFGKVVLGKTPSTKDEENYGSKYPFIKIPDMHGKVFVDETESYLSEKGGESQHKKYLPPDAISVSCIATPGLVTITSRTSQTNQQINSVVPTDSILREYLYLTFKHESRRIKRLASGGTATAILNKTDFSKVELLSPPYSVIQDFHDTCSIWFDLIRNSVRENQTLAETRDYLLPKLISGEIEVEAAEEHVESAAA